MGEGAWLCLHPPARTPCCPWQRQPRALAQGGITAADAARAPSPTVWRPEPGLGVPPRSLLPQPPNTRASVCTKKKSEHSAKQREGLRLPWGRLMPPEPSQGSIPVWEASPTHGWFGEGSREGGRHWSGLGRRCATGSHCPPNQSLCLGRFPPSSQTLLSWCNQYSLCPPPALPAARGLLAITHPWQERDNQNVTAMKWESPRGGAAPPAARPSAAAMSVGQGVAAWCSVPHTTSLVDTVLPATVLSLLWDKGAGGDSTSPHPQRPPSRPLPTTPGLDNEPELTKDPSNGDMLGLYNQQSGPWRVGRER